MYHVKSPNILPGDVHMELLEMKIITTDFASSKTERQKKHKRVGLQETLLKMHDFQMDLFDTVTLRPRLTVDYLFDWVKQAARSELSHSIT